MLFLFGKKYHPYEMDGDDRDPSKVELDDLKGIGKINKEAVEGLSIAHGLRFAVWSLALISSLPSFKEEFHTELPVLSDDYIGCHTTGKKWLAHLEGLLATPILSTSERRHAKFLCKYFAVMKSNGLARTIFNGRSFGRYMDPPMPINLPSIAEMLRVLSHFTKDKKIYCTVGDFRHYFHQFSLLDSIAQYFTLATEEVKGAPLKFFRWNRLPMGWQNSPVIAQSCGLAMILDTLARLGYDISKYREAQSPPSYIEAMVDGKVHGVIFLWVDNVLAVFGDAKENSDFYKAFRTNAADTYHLQLKEWKCVENGNPTYLNIEFKILAKVKRGRTRRILHWRHSQEKLDKWAARQEPHTCREWANRIGVLLWQHTISMQPLLLFSEMIDILRRVAVTSRSPIKRWDADFDPVPTDRILLVERQKLMQENEWHSLTDPECSQKLFAASDASDLGWGYIVWNDKKERLLPGGKSRGPFEEHMADTHIYFREMFAATLCVERICAEHPASLVYLAVDNTAAAAAITRMYSTKQESMKFLHRIHRATKHAGIDLRVVTVTSAQNAADAPSRFTNIDPVIEKEMFEIFNLYEHGLSKTLEAARTYQRDSARSRTCVQRHTEGEPEDLDFEEDLIAMRE